MLGKRSRSMRRMARGISMGLECPFVDTVNPPAEPVREKQTSIRISSPCPPRVILGFCPKACPLERDEDEKTLPETPAYGKQNGGSPKSRPTSGLESLRSSPRPSEEKNMQTAFSGLEATALNTDHPELPSGDVSSKIGATECGFTAARKSVHWHMPPCSELQQIHSCGPGNACKQSYPIPIARSPLHESTALDEVQQQNPADRRLYQIESKSARRCTGSARKFSEDYVNDDVEAGRCIFSLPTSPGTYEDTYSVISLGSMDFMEACFLCKRRLGQGHDIFMYKGDKAFCSDECRYQQIVIDEHAERREKCSSVALKTGTTIQSRRNNHKTNVLSVSTAAAA